MPEFVVTGPAALGRSRKASAVLGFALAAPAFLAASVAGAVAVDAIGSGPGLGRAAVETAAMAALYDRPSDADFAATLFPVAQGLAGRDDAGQPVACGIVITGLDAPGPDGTRATRWQRRSGDCATTRLAAGSVAVAGPAVAVEVFTSPAHGSAYALASTPAYAAPNAAAPAPAR